MNHACCLLPAYLYALYICVCVCGFVHNGLGHTLACHSLLKKGGNLLNKMLVRNVLCVCRPIFYSY